MTINGLSRKVFLVKTNKREFLIMKLHVVVHVKGDEHRGREINARMPSTYRRATDDVPVNRLAC